MSFNSECLPHLVAEYLLQGDAVALLGANGTLTSSPTNGAGPGSLYPQSVVTNGIDQYATVGWVANYLQDTTSTIRFSSPSVSGHVIAGSSGWFDSVTVTGPANRIRPARNASPFASFDVPLLENDRWYTLGWTWVASSKKMRLWLDGTESTSGELDSGGTPNSAQLGRDWQSTTNFYAGAWAGARRYSTPLTSSAMAEDVGGPEIRYDGGGLLGSNGAYSVGNWPLPAPYTGLVNGVPSYEVQLRASDGTTVLGTANTSTGRIAPMVTQECKLYVRGSNAGGYDAGDDGNGFYLVASGTVNEFTVTGARVVTVARPPRVMEVNRPPLVVPVTRPARVITVPTKA